MRLQGESSQGGRNDHAGINLTLSSVSTRLCCECLVCLGVINSQRISIQTWSSVIHSAFLSSLATLCILSSHPVKPGCWCAYQLHHCNKCVCVWGVVYIYACLYVCVYAMCISQVCGSCTCMCAHMYMEVRGQCLMSFSVTLHLIFWRQGVSTNLEPTNSAMPANPKDFPVSASVLGLKAHAATPNFDMDTPHPDSGLH